MSGGRTGLESRAQRTGESMGLIAHVDGAAEGYEEVALPLFHDEPQAAPGRSPAVLRRRSARPTKRAVIYLHCMKDAFVPADLAGWYTERGFQFYVADLRTPRGPAPTAARSAPLSTSPAWMLRSSMCGTPTESRPWCSARTGRERSSPPCGATPGVAACLRMRWS